mgnify:CR=1 FL=1
MKAVSHSFGSQDDGSSLIDDSLSAISPVDQSESSKTENRTVDLEYSERIDFIGEMEETDDWSKRTEADQAQILPTSDYEPENSISKLNLDKDRKNFAKIAFTDIPSQDAEQSENSGKEPTSLGKIRKEILRDLAGPELSISPNLSTNSDTESQGQEPETSLPIKPEIVVTSSPRPLSVVPEPEFHETNGEPVSDVVPLENSD